MALGPGLPIRMVWPSPFWRITSTVPMVPPPPERFSTTADWPQTVCRCAASNRPITSVLPPAAAGTMMRTVSVGRHSAPKLARGRMAAVEKAAAPARTLRRETWRREKALLVTSNTPCFDCCFAGSLGSARQYGKRTTWRRRCVREWFWLVEAEQLEQRRQVAELLDGSGCGAADEVEDLAVLQSVIGEPLHLAVLVEVDGNDPLVNDLLVHEGDFALGALRNVIEHLAVQGGDGGGRSHHDQHLILAGADRNLLERTRRQDITLLELLAGASTQRRAY